MEQISPLYSFGWGRWELSGTTYAEQKDQYKALALIREEMRRKGELENIAVTNADDLKDSKLTQVTKLWLALMDIVWEESCRRNQGRVAA